MKNIAAQMVNFDREQMRRIANNMPEQYDEKPQVQEHKGTGHYHREGGMVFLSALLLQSA